MFKNFVLKKKIYLNILFFLTLVASFIPFALILGALIAEVLIFFLSVFFIYFVYLKKIKKNYFDNFTKYLFLFWLYLFVKSLLNHEPSYSIIRSFFYFRYIFFAILIAYLITYYSDFRKTFFYFITATLIILVIHAYAQHLFNIDLFYLDFKNFSIIQNFNLSMTIYNAPLDYRISLNVKAQTTTEAAHFVSLTTDHFKFSFQGTNIQFLVFDLEANPCLLS
jgi:hypothetical protein